MKFQGTADYVATDDLTIAVNAAVTLGDAQLLTPFVKQAGTCAASIHCADPYPAP